MQTKSVVTLWSHVQYASVFLKLWHRSRHKFTLQAVSYSVACFADFVMNIAVVNIGFLVEMGTNLIILPNFLKNYKMDKNGP